MDNNNERAILDAATFGDEDFDFDKLEEQFSDLDIWQEEREYINNPDHLGETVLNVVWEQFMNQVAVTAGEDFIKESGGLTHDFRIIFV